METTIGGVTYVRCGIDHVAYDTRTFKAGDVHIGERITFFEGRAVGLNDDNGSVISPVITSLQLPGQLHKGNLLQIKSFSVVGIPREFYRDTLIDLEVDNRSYETGPLDLMCDRLLQAERNIDGLRLFAVHLTSYRTALWSEDRTIRVELHGLLYRLIV